jgi:DNA-directed RNA polymerase specialized sigma24 family protein
VLAAARRRREVYPGPWLPEPVLTESGALGPLESAEQRESVSVGLLTLLEGLSPPERAVFVLHEAFGYRHRDIAEALEADEATWSTGSRPRSSGAAAPCWPSSPSRPTVNRSRPSACS